MNYADSSGQAGREDTMQFVEYMKDQAARHPVMEPVDVMKLCFQAAFGAEHLLEDREAAYQYLLRECDQVQPEQSEPLYESISGDVCRVNLRAWKYRKLPVEWFFQMFAATAARPPQGGMAMFQNCLQEVSELADTGTFHFSRKEWEEFLRDYPADNPVAVHHSEAYRQTERPAYRLVCTRFLRIFPVLEAICTAGTNAGAPGRCVIAIDGRCASGKSTLADQLAMITGAGVIHMDDFFLPSELRTEARLKEPGGNVHYERFLKEVLPALSRGGDFSYRRFDCSRMELGEERKVSGNGILIVEGAYSCHPKLEEYMTLRVFSDVESVEQLRRIGIRDGELALETFKRRWIPMEENYFAAYGIREQADIIL